MPLWLQIVFALMPILLPIVAGLVATQYKKAVSTLPENQRAILDQVVRTVVPAVEQLSSAQLSGPGKKQMALEEAAKILQHIGVKSVNPAVLSSFIESAVYAINLGKSATTVVTQASPMTLPTETTH
jgi:hypothetical protein